MPGISLLSRKISNFPFPRRSGILSPSSLSQMSAENYDSSSIQVLEGLEAVRKRPGMYIGSTGETGLHHLLWEVADNCVDEALAGFCSRVEVRLLPGGEVEVRDNGRGIPVEKHPKTGKSTLETVMTKLHAGGKFDQSAYKVSGGLHGVGISVVNALSEKLVAEVRREGKIFQQEFRRGAPVAEVAEVGSCAAEEHGTTIRFLPDTEIFKETQEFSFKKVRERLKTTAFLTRGLELIVADEREGGEEGGEEKDILLNSPPPGQELTWRETVRALIWDPEKKKAVFNREGGFWELPGGGIDEGETPEEAVLRESKEETGLDCRIVRKMGKLVSFAQAGEKGNHGKNTSRHHLFLLEPVGGELGDGVELTETEKEAGLETRWLSFEDAFEKLAEAQKGPRTYWPLHSIWALENFSSPSSSNPPQTFKYDGGLAAFVEEISAGKEALSQIIHIEKEAEGVAVEVALRYTGAFAETLFSFANNMPTTEGGTHLTGFRAALTRQLNSFARKKELLKEKDGNFSSDDVREGLTAVVSVKLPDAQFESQTKIKLGNSEARTAVEKVVSEGLETFFEENPKDARAIIEKAQLAAKARLAARAARDAVVRKGALEGSSLPGKLADCSSKKPEESELFIVEGQSAGGSAKSGRDRHTQAILPLKGKVLNAERARLDKLLSNAEIKSLIIALGTGIGETFDAEKLRYHKIVIMTDADVDGSHIRTLLLTFFFRQLPELIREGKVFIAVPPLYKISSGKKSEWVFSEEELEEKREEFGERAAIQRFKGLGEMNAEQLWTTTMDPAARKMLRVEIEDAAAADAVFSRLMGDEVEPRREFIETRAKEVEMVDA
jgi:DNA gyrase/topoisomerase IV subunit B